MTGSGVYLSLIVPAWNGESRLPAALSCMMAYLRAQPFTSELIVVDDHSSESTARLLAALEGTDAALTVLRNERNRGKGYSVARGLLAAKGRYQVFMDADLAYPPSQITRIVCELERGADVAVACRVLPESRYVMSPEYFRYVYTRHLLSRVFNRLVGTMLLPGIADTQAGLKGFTEAAARIIFPQLTVERFGFDLECLFIAAAKHLRVVQTPVEFHYNDEPSTVRFVRDGARLAADVARIRWNAWRGRYR